VPLKSRRGVVLGVANKRSIAWGIARSLFESGAELALTYQGERIAKGVTALAEEVSATFVVPCDVTRDDQVAALFTRIRETWGGLDFLIHSLAYADVADLAGAFHDTGRAGFLRAHEISAFSLPQLARAAAPVMSRGGSIVTLSYLGAERVIPGYNVMGVAKASLEASVRYLANDLGPRGIRVNAISAGPIKTFAASGISGFSSMLKHVAERAPLRRNVSLEEIGATATFLVSSMSNGITGEVIHVDGGYNITSV
jgi:enoyl-[acyl-carrier protein] reductase I